MAVLDFQKTIFQKRNNSLYLFQNPKFSVKKFHTICCRPIPRHIECQISGWCIHFWQAYSPKTVFVDDVIFQTASLSISRHCTEIKMTFFGTLRSNWFRNTHFLFENINSKIWPYMTWGWTDQTCAAAKNQNLRSAGSADKKECQDPRSAGSRGKIT